MSLERECVIDNRLQICKTGGQEVGAEAMHFSEAAHSRSNDIWGFWGPAEWGWREAGVRIVGMMRLVGW